jgi:hypothetical protein
MIVKSAVPTVEEIIDKALKLNALTDEWLLSGKVPRGLAIAKSELRVACTVYKMFAK